MHWIFRFTSSLYIHIRTPWKRRKFRTLCGTFRCILYVSLSRAIFVATPISLNVRAFPTDTVYERHAVKTINLARQRSKFCSSKRLKKEHAQKCAIMCAKYAPAIARWKFWRKRASPTTAPKFPRKSLATARRLIPYPPEVRWLGGWLYPSQHLHIMEMESWVVTH
jgi:hypothetical protein